MEDLLEAVVRRDRVPDADLGLAGELRRRLFAEQPEQVGSALEVAARRRAGIGQQAHRKPDDDRVDPGVEQRDPGREPQRGIDQAGAHARRPHREYHREDTESGAECAPGDVLAVEDGDDSERDEVVDDGERQNERPQPLGEPWPDDGEHTQREGGVGGHRDPPAARGRFPRVDRQIDQDGRGHPREAGHDGDGEAAPLPQLSYVELAPSLQPDNEEEERHQPAGDPLPQVLRDTPAADLDRQLGPPDRLVRRGGDVHPDQGGSCCRQQDGGTAGLGAQELPQRRPAARPRGPACERLAWPVRFRHAVDSRSRPGLPRPRSRDRFIRRSSAAVGPATSSVPFGAVGCRCGPGWRETQPDDHQPRARHSARWGRSAPRVLSLPWPG